MFSWRNGFDLLCIVASGTLVWRCAGFAIGFVPTENLPAFMAHNLANSIHQMVRQGLRTTPLLLTLLGAAHLVSALEPSTPLATYGRQAWVMENGLPQNTVQALAQTEDGFIWLGTEVGLVRFDGNGFQVFDRNSSPALPGNDVRCLLASNDGTLWIGTSEGLAQWKNGVVTFMTAKDGLPEEAIVSLQSSGQSGIVMGTARGNFGYANGKWTRVISVQVVPPGNVDFVAELPGGERAVASKKAVVIFRGNGVVARLTVDRELPGSKIQALFADREGSLWIGMNRGLARWTGGKLEVLPVTDSLATASVLALMEDHEGNIWAGTEMGGLHILRDQRFRTFGARDGLSSDNTTAVVEGVAGKLWVGTGGAWLNALQLTGVQGDAARINSVRDVLLSNVILSLAAAPDGDLWVGTPDGLNRIRGSAVDSFTSADGLPDDFIRSLLVDKDGSLWIGTRRGLSHWSFQSGAKDLKRTRPRMETFTQANGLGSDLVGAMTRDSNGDLWIATLAGLSRMHAGKIENFTTANGLSSNVITALLARSNGTLAIGTQDRGWDVWDGRKFTAVAQEAPNQTSIHAIVDDAGGNLWFATGNGIARCDSGGMSGVVNGGALAGDCSDWLEFGTADGLRSRETATNSHPSAWRSRGGHLWFATPKGLVEVDPEHFPVNTVPPPVSLERFAVDDVDQALHAADSSLVLPPGHVHFQFNYAGLSFTAPQKVRYRYILEGFDKGWTEAGSRRTAYYTSLPPRRYTFRVQAANNDGVWNTAGAALTFELRPQFYQTTWFYVLLSAMLAGLIGLLLRRRLMLAESEFRAVLGERSRIAREIHDTLAQGYVGVSVQLEVLAELLRKSKVEAAAKQLDMTRGYVREGLADARQSIWALRSQDSGETTLPVRLRRMVEAARGGGLQSTVSIFGAYRSLDAEMEREILRVAQEAIHNVNKHAGAKNLFVQLEYGPNHIVLEVRDDGRGFVAVANHQSPAGHYGLTGMRERAAAIGGTLEVTSEQGIGTTVRLHVKTAKESG
jgi:signal transduction histidine kinase/ligand-binding sensor domain-containing protein